MSFLDATGLGTFWNKIKSTFQGPVSEIYKDAIAPVNILPNSIFIRNGGHPTSYSIASLADGNSIRIAKNMRLAASGTSFTNISLTISNNSISISGTAAHVVDWHQRLMIRFYGDDASTAWLDGGNTYTFSIKKRNSVNTNPSITQSGSGAVIYDDYSSDMQTRIITLNTGSKQTAQISITPAAGDNASFSSEIYDVKVYYGEFKGSVTTPSLDNISGNQFLLRDYSNFEGSASIFGGALTVNKRYRLFKISPNSDITTSSFTLIKAYNGSSPLMFNISFATSDIVYGNAHHYTAYIKINALSSNNQDVANMVKSAQVTYDADGNMYICITTGATTMNSNTWYISADRVSACGRPSSILDYISSITPFTESPSTDTVIVSANTIVGF